MKCEKCGSETIECHVDQGLSGFIVKNPEGAKLSTNSKLSVIKPIVCLSCGYTEWYAETPEKLL
ncbi:hypothetical protein MKX54_02440 [Alkalihalobacillus sp. FSL R5-0424]